jgi:hypothetical protein
VPKIANFLPSTHGLHFANSWPAGTPDYVYDVPPIGTVEIGDASNGLCGGMAFTVADMFNAKVRPPPDTSAPAGGTPLFTFIASRLLSSFNIPGGILTYYYWANTPNHDTGVWPFIRSGLARMTIVDQCPQITASIDAGRPATLGLVTVSSLAPEELKHCHQVLAYGYEFSGNDLTLRVYDPNLPDRDDITISLDTSQPAHTTEISSNVSSLPIRGFFFATYGFVDPTTVSGAPWSQTPVTQQAGWRWCDKCQGLFFGPNVGWSDCPKGGQHSAPSLSRSGNYTLHHNVPAGPTMQIEWRWCDKCQGLFYGPGVAWSVCPGSGTHADPAVSGSGNYGVLHTAPPSPTRQTEWRWCHKCQGLFFGPMVNSSGCPAGGTHAHPAASGSGNYCVTHVAA